MKLFNTLTVVQKAILASYGRSVLAGGLTLVMTGANNFGDFALALFAALVPVAIRAINPNDTAFGRMPSTEDVQAAVDVAVAKTVAKKKKPVKKTVTTKKTVKK